MGIKDFLEKEKIIVTDGPMETRMMYNTSIPIDSDGSIFRLVFNEPEREVLSNFYREDLDIVSRYNQAILLSTPTFRASPDRIKAFGFDPKETTQINHDCVRMIQKIREEYPEFIHKILISGPVGPKNDAYIAEASLTPSIARHYHAPQIEGLIEGGVDIVAGAAFPCSKEALGIAQCCSDFNFPYSISFVLTSSGKLLDGTPLSSVIEMIDSAVIHKPEYYMISCTHTSIANQAMTLYHENYKRIFGIKANGSAKSPEELAKLDKPEADHPTNYAQHMFELHQKFGFRILGGCCGTDSRHIEALCQIIQYGSDCSL